MNAKARVAVIEDDVDLCDSTVDFLDAKGYHVWGVNTGVEFFRRMLGEPVDVVILDVGLGKESGLDIASTLHASSNMAIIMVTALGQLEDRIVGLASGADTYLVKPVNFLELVANIEAVFRRLQHSIPQEGVRPWLLDTQKWLWLPPPPRGRSAQPSAHRQRISIGVLSGRSQGWLRQQISVEPHP
jgi:DNA-binding response OmpR family regulator